MTGGAKVIATFGPTTGWVDKTITLEGERFILQDFGPITAAAVMEYDRQGHLVWPHVGMRVWVAGKAPAPAVAAAREAQPLAMGFSVRVIEPDDVMPDVAPIHWSCIEDDDCCDACQALQGATWLPGATPPASAPLETCTSPEGCRCVVVGELAQ